MCVVTRCDIGSIRETVLELFVDAIARCSDRAPELAARSHGWSSVAILRAMSQDGPVWFVASVFESPAVQAVVPTPRARSIEPVQISDDVTLGSERHGGCRASRRHA